MLERELAAVPTLRTAHLLRDAPAVMGPPDADEVDVVRGLVVVVVGGLVVVVGAVVVAGVPPPAPVPPVMVLPVTAVVAAVGERVGNGEESVVHRLASPENWPSLSLEARVRTTFERTALESLALNADADAEASMLIIVKRTQDATASVRILGMRCVVFARKNLVSEPLYMQYKFAFSNHTSIYEISTLTQFTSDEGRNGRERDGGKANGERIR